MTRRQAGDTSTQHQPHQAYGFGEPLVMAQFNGEPLPQMQQAGGLLDKVETAPA